MRVAARICLVVAVLLATTLASAGQHKGRPTVKLDRLEFPADIAGAPFFKKRLRKMLQHHARHVDWGAGRGSVIEYRFFVRELAIDAHDDVIHVSCTAYGKLPNGKTAKSQITFGGAPSKRNHLVLRVLDIVSRGVVTRLAEMERIRRGDLDHRRVRAPHVPDAD